MKSYLSQINLNNYYIIEKISNLINPLINSKILEIGSGKGNLSFYILKKFYNYNIKIYFLEIDKNLCYELKKKFNNILLINKNIIKFNLNLLIKNFYKIHIIGNLPYKISYKIFLYFLKYKKYISDHFVMIQKEFYLKIKFVNNNINFFSIFFNSFYKINNIINISKNNFSPKVNVDSCFIKLSPLYLPIIDNKNIKEYKKFLKIIFLKKNIINKIKKNNKKYKIENIIINYYNYFKNINNV